MAPKMRRHHRRSLPNGPNVENSAATSPNPSVEISTETPHVHTRNMKNKVVVTIWSRHNGCYEAEFCPQCSPDEVSETLVRICEVDASFFSSTAWPTLGGLNGDTIGKTYCPKSTTDMAAFMALINTRNCCGGQITLRIVDKAGVVRNSHQLE